MLALSFLFLTLLGSSTAITPSQLSALNALESRIDSFTATGIESPDAAVETAINGYLSTQTVLPLSVAEDPPAYSLYEIGRIEAVRDVLATQTWFTGAARESYVSDIDELISLKREIAGVTNSAAETTEAELSATSSAAATSALEKLNAGVALGDGGVFARSPGGAAAAVVVIIEAQRSNAAAALSGSEVLAGALAAVAAVVAVV